MIKVICEHCDKSLTIKDAMQGERIKCPSCGEILEVPSPAPVLKRRAEVRRSSDVSGRDQNADRKATTGDKPQHDRPQCPQCGSPAIVKLNKEQTNEFYGRNRYILNYPRKCLDCGHIWELKASKSECLLMIVVGIGLVLAGVGTIFAGIIQLASSEFTATRKVVGLSACLFFGIGFVINGVWTFSKYCRRLRSFS